MGAQASKLDELSPEGGRGTGHDDRARLDRAHDHYCRGVACEGGGRLSEALANYLAAIEVCPSHAPAHNNVGVIRQQFGQLADAIAAYRRAVDLEPRFGLAWYNLGNALREDNHLEEAAECYRQAQTILPADDETRINRAITLKDLHRFDAALAALDEIPTASPHFAKAGLNRAFVHLTRGELGEGWDHYEARLQIDPDARLLHADRWDGSPLSGRSILIFSEQGIGDQVMFASCLPNLLNEADLLNEPELRNETDVARQAGACFVECDARLVPLFARSFPKIRVFAKTVDALALSAVEPGDVVAALGTLPRFLRRRAEDFPQTTGYLRPDLERVAAWRSRFARLGSALKVGISWQGGKDAETRRRRSIPLDLWGPIFEVPGVRFVNLQYGPAAADSVRAQQRFGIPLDDGSECDPLENLDDFAARLAALDLVLTVDNSTAHLAAAVGRPVWTLLPWAADWRWMLDRETSPWYPTMRLFRCPATDQWSELVRHTARRLTSAVFSRDFVGRAA
jgi:tetratricopeptide (TPR) repeat protein